MKKGLEKFVSILLLVLGVILIVFLSLAVFGELDDATMKNEVVRTMILGLAFVFLVCSIAMIVASFKDNDVLKAVVLSSERASTTRVSLSVIKKIVAKNAKYISGLKISGVALQLDENNAIRMKLTVKISENDVDFVVDRFRCLLYDAFYATLGVEFASIDFKVKALSPKYAPDMNKVDRAAAEIKEKREKLMLQKLKMEEEEAKFEEERKLEAEKRRREEARLRREREEERKRGRLQLEKEQFGDLEDAEEVPVYVIDDDFEMPNQIAGETSEEQPDGETEENKSTDGNVNFGDKSDENSSESPAAFFGEQTVAAQQSESKADAEEEPKTLEEEKNDESPEQENRDDSVAETAQSLDESRQIAYAETETSDTNEGNEVGDDVIKTVEVDSGAEPEDGSKTTNEFPDNGKDEINKTEE